MENNFEEYGGKVRIMTDKEFVLMVCPTAVLHTHQWGSYISDSQKSKKFGYSTNIDLSDVYVDPESAWENAKERINKKLIGKWEN